MAITENKIIDQIEVVQNGTVQIREATIIEKDGSQIAKTFHRWTIVPGQDYSNESGRVKAICEAVHTPKIIEEYNALVEASKFA
jgi:hypothetical protein